MFPADKVSSVPKPQEGENTAVTFKNHTVSHSFTINGDKWRAGKKILEHLYFNTHTRKMKNGNGKNIWIEDFPQHQNLMHQQQHSDAVLCCVHPDGDKFNNYFSVVQDAGRCGGEAA